MLEDAQVAILLYGKHNDEEMDIYCITCNRPTCTKCLNTDHQGHNVDTIQKLSRKISNRPPDLLRELKKKVDPIREQNRRHLRYVKCGNEALLNENLKNVAKKRSEVHKMVDKLIDAHVDCIKSHSAKLDEEMKKEVDNFQKDEKTLVKMLETFEKTTMVGLDLIEYYERMKSKVDTMQILHVSQYCSKQIFQEGEVDRANLKKMIGKIEEIKTSMNNFQMISSFQQNTQIVHTICPISQYEAWITYSDAREFTYLRRDGRHIKSVKKNSAGLSFIARDGGFLVCDSQKKNITKVDVLGKLSTWIDTSPLRARFIDEGLNGNVLVTLVDEKSGTRTERSQRRVEMLCSSGALLQSLEYGEDGSTPVLTLPCDVTQSYNSDICVVNSYEVARNEWRGNVCVFYENGGFRFSYNGHGIAFSPRGICCDLLCNILCANYLDYSIHVVSSDGYFLRYLFTHDTCIPRPITLTLHRGVLWVGSVGGEVRVYRYGH